MIKLYLSLTSPDFTGSKSAKVLENGHNRIAMYNQGCKYNRTDCERLFRQLVVEGILDEELHVTAQDHTVCYVRLGKRADDLLRQKCQVCAMETTDQFIIIACDLLVKYDHIRHNIFPFHTQTLLVLMHAL